LEGIIKKDETLPGVIDNAVAVNYPPDNKIYIFGGRNCDVYGEDILQYDSIEGEDTAKANLRLVKILQQGYTTHPTRKFIFLGLS
jgi:hypothetical protein